MRKIQKKWAEDFLKLLSQVHDEIMKALETKKNDVAMDLLEQCQDDAIRLGELIEKAEGERFTTIPFLEDYCELTYQIHEEIGSGESVSASSVHKKLRKSLIRIQNSVRNDIKIKLEIAFLPYKASMWDSLESVWMAADTDPDCDAYVVPIPYYERNADGSLGTYHYEGSDIPDYVPVTHYDRYHLEERQPDVIYIHNPYDQGNYVTSIDPRYYSSELKKYTELLIYIPYYSTSGGMSEAQSQCIAYYNADYIVIQAEKYRKFFDASIPQEKLLPLGSPKFDRVIRMSNNPPEPPIEWKRKMEGKKVYFYNTSIDGMLSDTKKFLLKMEYVFKCFQGREDACVVWRPHPLLETTFESMRKNFRPFYDELKRYFIENNLGIYDDTPDIEKTIALCDTYIGDAGTSVTSLFGIVGKPLFILNNNINTLPEENDWRGEIINTFFTFDSDEWMITQGNKLYRSPNRDYQFQYYCDLSEYASGGYYFRAFSIDGKVYVCPANAQDILVVADGKVEKHISLKESIEQPGAFAGTVNIGKLIFLLPNNYPYIVKYDTSNGKIDYIDGYKNVFIAEVKGEKRFGGFCIWKDYWLISSPVDNRVIAIDSRTNKVQVLVTGAKKLNGCMIMLSDETDIWLFPYIGDFITRWNPESGELQEYSGIPEGFKCVNKSSGSECIDKPFHNIAFSGEYVYLAPFWGNKFIRLDKNSGKMEEWIPPFPVKTEELNGYYTTNAKGYFIWRLDSQGNRVYRYWSLFERRLYEINFERNEYEEIPIVFDTNELQKQEAGFCENSEWLQYACTENSFNTLEKFLNNEIAGADFEKDRQIKAYGKIASNNDGTSGKKIHSFVRSKL